MSALRMTRDEPDFAAPGRLVGDRWVGDIAWTTQHGPVSCDWVVGHIHAVSDAALTTGERTGPLRVGDPDSADDWRRLAPSGAWIHGRIVPSENDVLFIDGSGGREPARHGVGTLPGDLIRDPVVHEALADLDFARDVYGALCRTAWVKRRTGKEYWGKAFKAASLVAQIRNLGEVAGDFLMMGNEGEVTQEVADLLDGCGWTYATPADADAAHRRAVSLVASCEARPSGRTPRWYRTWGHGLSDEAGSLSQRFHLCAVSGRATHDQWHEFWENLDLDRDGA